MAPTWLVTGSSSGFGRSLVRHVLARGHNVIATSRNPHNTPGLVEKVTSNQHGRWMALDVSAPATEIAKVIQAAWDEFDGIDYLVNNAGYSLLGAAEDISEEAAKLQFEVNFWGLVRTTKAVLPLMRSRNSGAVINVSSIAGIDAVPTCAMYAASKFAVEAWSESLSKEVAAFGIRVVLVEPGAFRTNFFGVGASEVVPASEPYRTGPVKDALARFESYHNKQPGDPNKAAACMFEVMTGEDLSHVLRLPLGPDAHKRAVASAKSRLENFAAVETIASSTNFDA